MLKITDLLINYEQTHEHMSVYMRNNIECYEYHVNPEQSNNADVRSSSLLLVLRRQSRMDQAWVGGWQAVCVCLTEGQQTIASVCLTVTRAAAAALVGASFAFSVSEGGECEGSLWAVARLRHPNVHYWCRWWRRTVRRPQLMDKSIKHLHSILTEGASF